MVFGQKGNILWGHLIWRELCSGETSDLTENQIGSLVGNAWNLEIAIMLVFLALLLLVDFGCCQLWFDGEDCIYKINYWLGK